MVEGEYLNKQRVSGLEEGDFSAFIPLERTSRGGKASETIDRIDRLHCDRFTLDGRPTCKTH